MHGRSLIAILVLAAASAQAASQQSGSQGWFIMLEDGKKLSYGDLRAASGNKCCFKFPSEDAVSFVSSPRLRLFISKDSCDPTFEVRRTNKTNKSSPVLLGDRGASPSNAGLTRLGL